MPQCTGSGNTWSKKNKYSICPGCGKKGWYKIGCHIGDEFISYSKCKYCETTQKG